MSNKPRIFVSAVSSEFPQTRQDVANILARLGYEPVLQDVFGTEAGDLRQMLRDKIDACDGLLQLVGQAYGFEPPSADEEFGRISYTQFEYLYARKTGKKTWLILTRPGFGGESAADQLDLPREADPSDPKAFQAERRALQESYRERLRKGTDVWYDAADKTELALKVERLRDDLAALRRAFRSWQQRVTRSLAVAMVLLAIVAGGVTWVIYRQHKDDPVAKALAALNPDLIRAQLEKSIKEAYDRDAAEARKLPDWKERQKALKAAGGARDQKLGQLDAFLGSITRTIASGQASPEFLELSRILQEQGVNAALEYLSSQESQLFDRASRAKALAAMYQREVRQTLAPELEGVRLNRSKDDLAEAERLCKKLLDADADWPEARDAHVWTMIARGDRALSYENLAAARQRFESARASAERLVQLDSQTASWQRDLSVSYEKLGNVSRQGGHLDAAREFYQQGLDIAKRLAAADPANAQAQRDLSISYNKLGDVSQQGGHLDAAREFYQQDLDIAKRLAAADPANAEAQRDLSVSYERLGDVSRQGGHLDAAREYYQQDLDMCKKLAAADPANAQAQRDLSISYNKLGDVSQQGGHLDAARGFFQQYLDMCKRLAAADPANAQAQRDLSISYNNLGNVSQQGGHLDAARGFFQQYLDMCKRLAAADPANAQAQRDLSISYNNLGNVSRKGGHVDAAREFYQQGLDIAKRLAAADPANAQAQRDLSISYNKLGDVSWQGGHVDAAREFYQQDLDICKRLAAADPANAQAQRDLSISYERLGDVSQQGGHLDAAREFFQQGLDIAKTLAVADATNAQARLDLLYSYNKLGDVSRQAGELDAARALYQQAVDIAKTLAAADAANAEVHHDLVVSTLNLAAARGNIDGVAEAAEALVRLEPKTPANLFEAACGYGLCAKLAVGWPGRGPFPPPRASANAKDPDEKSTQKYLRAAIDLLQAAVKAGYRNFPWIQHNPDLAALRDLPEFKNLLIAAEPRGH